MAKLKKHVRNYTQVGNDITNDKKLSLKAKGLFLYILSKPENWNFSARLIATQNKDSIASVNTGLRELEDFGLINRIHVQGGYDYEIFDTVQVHLVENRLNGKSIKQKAKIHSMENQPNISNKEPLAIEEEERIITDDIIFNDNCSLILSPVGSSAMAVYDFLAFKYPDFDLFISYAKRTTKKIHSPVMFEASIKEAFYKENHKFHLKTILAYDQWKNQGCPQNANLLPDGVSIFDLIGRV